MEEVDHEEVLLVVLLHSLAVIIRINLELHQVFSEPIILQQMVVHQLSHVMVVEQVDIEVVYQISRVVITMVLVDSDILHQMDLSSL